MTLPATTAPADTSSSAVAARLPIRAQFGSRYRGVRWRDDVGFELRCDTCPSGARYWPLTLEFWNITHGLSRCAACWLVYWRRRVAARRRADPELIRARDRARYRKNRKVILIKRAEYAERNRETLNAKARARYAARVAA